MIPGRARNVRDVRKLLRCLPEVTFFEAALLEDRASPHPGEAIGLQLFLDGEEPGVKDTDLVLDVVAYFVGEDEGQGEE